MDTKVLVFSLMRSFIVTPFDLATGNSDRFLLFFFFFLTEEKDAP